MDSGLTVPYFLPSDDPITSLNKAMQLSKMGQLQCRQFKGDRHRVNGDTVTIGQASQEIPTPTPFQTDNLDAFESDCDEAPSASAVLMAKLSNYDSNILLEVPTHDTYLDNQVIDQSVQEMQYSEQPVFNNDSDIDITSDSNMISYEQYLKETENTVVQDTLSLVQQDTMLMSMIEEMYNKVTQCKEIHDALSVIDTEETLELAKDSRLKMHAKQNDLIAKEKKVNIAPIDYAALTKLSEHFVNLVMHADVEPKNVLPANNNSLANHNLEAKMLKKENDRLFELTISQDLVHTAVNTLATIANHRNMETSYLDEYNKNLELQAELSKRNDMDVLKSANMHHNPTSHLLHLKMILENVNNNVGELVGLKKTQSLCQYLKQLDNCAI
ncbi:hypothetical protein Tco_0003520 [Tanacetum coccineum]